MKAPIPRGHLISGVKASITIGLAGFLIGVLGASSAEASIPRDASRSTFTLGAASDTFATAPQLKLTSFTEELKAIDARVAAASECVALCELVAGIEAHPFGRAELVIPFGTQDAWGNYRFTSELAPSHNRFGFTGHYWDNESSLYYAKARFYDPFTARFTQSDSFLGDIDNPPSLHRFAYGHANPTMFVDPTGHIVDKIVDQQIRDSQYTGKYRDSIGWLYNFANAARQQAGYEAANVFTFGALRRQDTLVDQNLEGKITDQQYWNRTGANAALSGVQAALTIIPGGTAATATRAIVTGATTGVIGQGVSDVGEIYGTKTKSIDDVKGSDYLLAASLGGLSGYAGYKSRPVTIEEPQAPLPPKSGGNSKPQWLKDQFGEGDAFNRERAFDYPHREVYVERKGGGYNRVDAYDPIKGEIVSRKLTQFSEVTEGTGVRYVQELANKYRPGAKIANVPSSGPLAGSRLRGQMILEVPGQQGVIPQAVLDAAKRAGVVIRDVHGHVY